MATRQLTIEEAAEHLAVSPVTVRRRIKKGDLMATKEPTAQGFSYRVTIEVPEVDGADTSAPTESSPPNRSAAQSDDQRLVEELRGQVDYLKGELVTRKAEHDRDRDDWRDELQRVHALMAQQGQTIQQQGQTIQALTRRVEQLPASVPAPTEERPIHTYLSQFVPLAVTTLGGVAVFVWRTVQVVSHSSTLADKASFGLSLAALFPLVALRWLPRAMEPAADPADRLRDLRGAALFILFYLLGTILLVASIIVAVVG